MQGLGPRLGKVGSLVAAILAFRATPGGLGVLVVAALPAALLALGLWDVIEDHWLSGLALLGLLGVLLSPAARFATVRRAGSVRATAVAAVVTLAALGLMVWLTARDGREALSVTSWFLIVALSLVVALMVAVVREAVRVIADNDYGLVGGSSHARNQVQSNPSPSGSTRSSKAWRANMRAPRRSPSANWPGSARTAPPPEGGVNLTILTTCISRGRTYYLPYDFHADDPGDRFWFDPDELRRVLPGHVIDYLQVLPREGTWIEVALDPLMPVPRAKDLPMIMAVRMSLSLSALISAVRLRSVDWTLEHNRRARRAWRDYVERMDADPGTPRPAEVPI